MSFASLLTDEIDYLHELADKMHKSNLPLFIYGAGKCADILYKLFTSQQVKFDEIVISMLPKNQVINFHGHKVKE